MSRPYREASIEHLLEAATGHDDDVRDYADQALETIAEDLDLLLEALRGNADDYLLGFVNRLANRAQIAAEYRRRQVAEERRREAVQ